MGARRQEFSKNCETLNAGELEFCSRCQTFSCVPLKQLEKRYTTKYPMSMAENLDSFRRLGNREFVSVLVGRTPVGREIPRGELILPSE